MRLSTYSAIWILMLLFVLTVTENKLYPKRNICLLDLRKERAARYSSGKFWKRRLLYKNEVMEAVGSLNETSRLVNNQLAKDTNFNNGELGNVMEKGRTLMDCNGPVIIGEALDNKSDQDFADHVRVKRNGPTNDSSIIRHQSNHSVFDFFPRNFWSNRSNRTVHVNMPHSRHKRGILSINKQRAKRTKRNIKHSKHRIKTENGDKKHNSLRSSHKSAIKIVNNSKKRSKKSEIVPAKAVGESWIEKRESGNEGLSTDLARPSITDKEEGNAVALPFVHTGKAELRVRIEKIPKNESLLINNWTNHSIGTTTTCPSTVLLKYGDESVDKNVNATNLVPNFDSTEREKINNLSVEIIVKQLDSGNASFYNADLSHPVGSDLSRSKDDQDLESGEYNRVKISSDEDAKSRAKRNQEITSRRYLRSDRNAAIGSKTDFTNEQGTSIEDIKHKETRYQSRGTNRAARSIEEIKELAEKLIVKVNELQAYVSNRINESRYTTEICVDRKTIEGTPRISSERKRVAKVRESKFEIAKNIDNRRGHSARSNGERVTLAGKRASSSRASSFGGSRFARRENPTQRNKWRRKWGRWLDWSSCSVTCGKGRQIRWRHCLRDCNDAETEMEEKACQLPACPPGKFLGIF